MNWCALLSILLGNILLISANSQFCVNHDSCDKCLNADMSCSFCTDRQYDMRRARCMTREDLIIANCRSKYIQTNQITEPQMVKNEPLRDYTKDQLNAVQIKPQKVKVTLNKAASQKIKFTYKLAKNYPLDLYYLMDLTWSMKDDKETLSNVGGSLSTSLRNLTENFKLGFGSFADKPTMPFILLGTEDNPCKSVRDICEPTYGFKHRLTLTDNVKDFVDKVNSSDVTANLDNLEGGADALMQVLVCPQIGWNKISRKIVVFATDGLMHFAGDGQLAGVIKKNDKKCHLNEFGDYMAALEYDYPSLEELYHELIKSKINVIFATTKDVVFHYDQIKTLMPEISSIGTLSSDSSNILSLVEKGYKEVHSRVQFDGKAPDFIKVQFKTTCGDKFGEAIEINKCDNIEIGNEYEFEVQFTLLKYPTSEDMNITIKIEEAGTSSEFLEVELVIEPPCKECQEFDTEEEKSPECNGQEKFQCGVCECEAGFIGKKCECNLQNYASGKELENQCRVPNNNGQGLGAICSDRGECYCGQCWCNANYDGSYCECDICPIINGVQCGARGICNCGTCECKPGWKGENCECSSIETTCKAPHDDAKLCSGHGKCDCGRCECDQNYFGNFCESTADKEANNTLCLFYEPCVQCILQRKLGQECDDSKLLDYCRSKEGIEYKHEYVDDVKGEIIKCITRLRHEDEICEFDFTYENFGETQMGTQLKIQNVACPAVNYAAYGIGGVAIATFILGLIILCAIKINIMIADKREFMKFEEERAKTEYMIHESPLYKSPVMKFENPFRYDPDAFELK